MPEEKKAQPTKAQELEIVELDDRLDMAFDPMSIVGTTTNFDPNTNCFNSSCCPKPTQ